MELESKGRGGYLILMMAFVMITYLMIPALMIFFGRRWGNNPPKKINSIYGYRTKRSMQSQESWVFAHMYIANIWWYSGIGLLLSKLLIFNRFPLHLDAHKTMYLIYAYA